MSLGVLLLVIALVFFLLAAFNVPTKVSWMALGLAFLTLAFLLGGRALSLG